MAFMVKYRGLDVTVESLDQLDQLADRVAPNSSGGRKTNASVDSQSSNTHERHEGRDQALRKMIAGIVGNQRKFLVLLATEGKKTDAQFRESLGLDSNKALAGVLTGITKASKRAGLQGRLIDRTSFRSSGGEREYTYSLNPAFKDEVQESL